MVDLRIAKPPPPGSEITVNVWTAPFWAAAAQRRLVLPRCSRCRRHRMPPTPFCPYCRAQGIDWQPAPDDAALYSYTIVERAVIPGTEDSLPYVPAVVEFPSADGVRLISNVVGSALGALEVGAALRLAWLDLPGGGAVPVFELR